MRRHLYPIIVALGTVAGLGAGCGGDDGKSSGGGSAPSASATARPKTRTANTPLAALTSCYRPADETLCEIAERIVELTNDLRDRQGHPPLRMHAGWSHVADVWSIAQAQASRISHDGFPNARLGAYEREFGNDGMPPLAAENVARIDINTDDAERLATAFVAGWWQSEGHRRNMEGAYEHLGVGVAKGANGSYFATQIFGRVVRD